MITWAQIILAILRLVNWMIGEAEKHKWMDEGEKRQIAKATAEVLKKQEFARETLKEIEHLSDSAVDDLLHELAGGERQLLSDVPKGPEDPERRIDESIQRSEGSSGNKRG